MSSTLLTAKLYVRPPRFHLVQRPHLVARLNEALCAGHRLILASAPAGFGKTTLLSAWISGKSSARSSQPAFRDPQETVSTNPQEEKA